MASPNTVSPIVRSLKPLSWQAEELIANFEHSMRDNSEFDVRAALSTIDSAERSRVIAELACIDLESMFTDGQPPEVSGFLTVYSEEFSKPEWREEVGREHYRLLRLHNVPVDRQSVADKYRVDGSSWLELPLGSSATEKRPFPQTGSLFCGHPLIAELGDGSLGRVYLARQPDLASRLVVLKVTRHLTTEASELAKLQHVGVIPVYSIHQHAGLFAICMPYLGAVTLAHLLSDSRVFRHSKCEDLEQCRQLASTLVSTRMSMIASTVRVAPLQPDQKTNSFDHATNSAVDKQASCSDSSSEQVDRTSPCERAKQTSNQSVTISAPFVPPESISQLLGLDELASSLCEKILSRPPLEAKVDLMRGIANAVAHAHRRNLIHHDLKPENILIANDGHPVLLDFNLAQSNQSRASVAGGTIPYMSAQHLQTLQGTVKPSPTNDIFSLGVIFYQLLSGQLPYPGNDANAFIRYMQERRTPPRNLQSFDRSIPSSLCGIVAKCLSFAPEDRYQSAEQLEEDLTRYANFFPLRYAPAGSPAERAKKWMRRHPLLASNASLASIAALIVLSLGLAWSASQRRTEKLEASRLYRESLSDLPETLSMLQSPGVEPELLQRGIASGKALLHKIQFVRAESGGFSFERMHLLESDESLRIQEELGRLFFYMANAELQLVLNSSEKSTESIEQARQWNSFAASVAPNLKLPAQFQAEQIANLQHGNSSKVIAAESLASSDAGTYAKMLTAYQSGLTTQWASLADELVTESPHDPGRWFSLASAQLAQGELKSALSSMDVAARLQSKSSTATFWRGVLRLKCSDFAGARDDFSACLLRQEDLLAARYNRALALKALNNNVAALEDLNWIVDHLQATPRTYSLRSQLFVALGDMPRARADVQAAIDAQPESADDWVARGVLKIQTDPNGALANFQQALKVDPRNTAAYFNSAHVYSEVLGNVESAIKSLTSLVDAGQGNASVIASRGILYARNKQPQQAAADAKAAAELQPNALEMLQIAGIYSLSAESENDLTVSGKWLARSIASSGDMESLAAQDPDLAKLRASPKFAQILGR